MAAWYGQFAVDKLREPVKAMGSPKIGKGARNFHCNQKSKIQNVPLTNRNKWSALEDDFRTLFVCGADDASQTAVV